LNEHHYSRIDAGQTRYKGQPDTPSRTEQPKDPKSGKFLPSIPPEERHRLIGEALEVHAHGNSLRAIAEQIGVTHGTVRRWLLSEVPQKYRKAQEAGLIARIVDVDEELEEAATPLSIARAREAARFARWDAERRLPHLFGPKQEVTHTIKPEFTVILKAGEKEIDQAETELLPTVDNCDVK
jgi:transcriptional regulator with XRE-family HTH domain